MLKLLLLNIPILGIFGIIIAVVQNSVVATY